MQPLITDWIQSIAAVIAVPGAIVSFFILFKRDRNKEKQLKRLTEIANNHQLIASEMQQQTFRMSEQNAILEKQFELQQKMFLSGINESEQIRIRQVEENKIRIQQRKNDIKPYLGWAGNSSSPEGRIGLELKNRGAGEARDIEIKVTSGDVSISHIHPTVAPAGSNIKINLRANNSNAYSAIVTLTIYYVDIDGNKYYQQIDKSSENRFSITDPKEY